MKKLLVVAPQNPYPAKDGGKFSIYYPLINFTKHFEVHFAFFTSRDVSGEVYQHFKEHNIIIYPLVKNTADKAVGYLFNFFNALPYKFQKYTSYLILKKLEEICNKENITAVWCNHAHVGWYGLQLKKIRTAKIYLREHNIEYSLVQQVMQVQKNPVIKAFVWYQYEKTKRFEYKCWESFDNTFFISDSDFAIARKYKHSEKFIRLYDSFSAQRTPGNRDIQKSMYSVEKEPFSFIFTAKIDSFQNKYNLQKFINDIWKPLIAKDNRWKLYVTGNEPHFLKKHLNLNLEQNNIISLGFVDNIQAIIASKKYFISPTYIGSGLRIKVLNALAQGEVCFVTSLDLKMLNSLKDGYNIVEYIDFDTFYSKLLRLENDRSLLEKISFQAKLVGTTFSWSNYVDTVYNEISKIEGFTGR